MSRGAGSHLAISPSRASPLTTSCCRRLIVNAAYAVDSLTSETEQGRALREIALLDPGFDQYTFVEDMTVSDWVARRGGVYGLDGGRSSRPY